MISFLKFLVVGTIGFIINTTILVLGVRAGLKPSISGPLGRASNSFQFYFKQFLDFFGKDFDFLGGNSSKVCSV